jgi:uncharacterized protein YfkK (UPF0435 family)
VEFSTLLNVNVLQNHKQSKVHRNDLNDISMEGINVLK